MLRLRAEPPLRAPALVALSVFDMEGDLLHAQIEDADRAAIPSNPYLMAQVLWRRRVIGFVHLDMPVSIDLPLHLRKEREPLEGKGQQRGTLDFFKGLFDLLAGGAVDAGIRDVPLPVEQVVVLFLKAGEVSAL